MQFSSGPFCRRCSLVVRVAFLAMGLISWFCPGSTFAQEVEEGECELTYQSMALPPPGRARHELSLYTAEPGTAHEERLALLASWRAPAATSRL